jgi:hypothetical protein
MDLKPSASEANCRRCENKTQLSGNASMKAQASTDSVTEAVNKALKPRSLVPSSAVPSIPQNPGKSVDQIHSTQPIWRANPTGPEQPLRALFASGATTLTPSSSVMNKTPHIVIAIGRAGPREGAPDLQHSQRNAFETAALSQLQQLGVGSSDKCTAFMVRGNPKTASFSIYTIWNTQTSQGRQALQEILSNQALSVPWRGIRVAVPIDIAPTPPPPNAVKILTTHLNPYLACTGYTQTILSCAGYATAPASNNSFELHPTHAQVISEHLGEATWLFGPTSSGNAGAILSWVIPPANDPLLQHMPSSFQDADGKTTFIKVFRPAKPITPHSTHTPDTQQAANQPQPGPAQQSPQHPRQPDCEQTAMDIDWQNLQKRRTPHQSQSSDSPSAVCMRANETHYPTNTPSKRGKPTTQQASMDMDTSIPNSPRPNSPQPNHTEVQTKPQSQPARKEEHAQANSKPPWEGHPFTAQINQYLEDLGTPPTLAHKTNALNYLYANNKALFDQNALADERPSNLTKKAKIEISKALRYTSDTSTRNNNCMLPQAGTPHEQVMHSPGQHTPRGVQPQ